MTISPHADKSLDDRLRASQGDTQIQIRTLPAAEMGWITKHWRTPSQKWRVVATVPSKALGGCASGSRGEIICGFCLCTIPTGTGRRCRRFSVEQTWTKERPCPASPVHRLCTWVFFLLQSKNSLFKYLQVVSSSVLRDPKSIQILTK